MFQKESVLKSALTQEQGCGIRSIKLQRYALVPFALAMRVLVSASTSNPPPSTRHVSPPSIVDRTYHSTAAFLSQTLNNHMDSAIIGGLMHAQGNNERGIPFNKLDMDVIQDQATLNTARSVCESMHGDSSFANSLRELQSKAGPATTFTNLPGNDAVFNTRMIPSSYKNHHEHNNRLAPSTDSSRRGCSSSSLYPAGVNPSVARTTVLKRSEDQDLATEYVAAIQLS